MITHIQTVINRIHLDEITLDGADDRYGLNYAPVWIARAVLTCLISSNSWLHRGFY